MANALLLTLPVELLHRIFDYCDVQTILLSVRCVCKQLYAVAGTYDRFDLNLNSKSISSFRLISRLIRPETVISLTISRDWFYKDSPFSIFVSLLDTRRFTRLRSLTLVCVDDSELEHFSQYTITNSLASTSIESKAKVHNKTWALISSVLVQYNLRKLCLNHLDYRMEHISWPAHYELKHLEIKTCIYHEYCAILYQLPYLRTFVMRDCTMNDADHTFASFSACTFSPSLVSLTITDCTLPTEQLESLLSLTPKLQYLKLVSKRKVFDSVFDGSEWERFIQTKLPLLNTFEFFFSYSYVRDKDIINLNTLITPFRTPFWLDDKRWFVACVYQMRRRSIRIHTTKNSTTEFTVLKRCVRLWPNTFRLSLF
jgi:hypothetical protein